MDKKILPVIAVAAVAVVLMASAFSAFNGDDDDDRCSDYMILDSYDNIRAGLTVRVSCSLDDGPSSIVYRVTSVADEMVDYTKVENGNGTNGAMALKDFDPDKFTFNFTDDEKIPEGVAVTSSGNVYTLEGTMTEGKQYPDGDYTRFVTTFDNLRITVGDGGSCTGVSGKMTHEETYHYGTETDSSETRYTFSMEGGELVTDASYTDTQTASAYFAFYFDRCMDTIDEWYHGCTVSDGTDVRFSGIDAVQYSVTGTDRDGNEYDLEVITYNDFILKSTGTCNSESYLLQFSVYYD